MALQLRPRHGRPLRRRRGREAWEEIDIELRGTGHRNYGWRITEGKHCTTAEASPNGDCVDQGNHYAYGSFTAPVHDYPHAYDADCVIGGYVYRGANIPSLVGYYLYADFGSSNVWALAWDGADVCAAPVDLSSQLAPMHPTSFGEDADGELYIVDYDGSSCASTRAEPHEALACSVQVLSCQPLTEGPMSKRNRPRSTQRHAAPPGQLHEMLRDLAKWAVASSLGAAAGCSAHQPELEMRQSEPHDNPTAQPSADPGSGGRVSGDAGMGAGDGGTAGTPRKNNGNDPDNPTGTSGVGGMGAGTGAGGTGGSAGVGAGGAGGSTPPPSDDWKPIDCVDSRPQVLVNITFKQPFDYVGLFASYPGGLGQGGQYPASTSVVDETGTQCANASDMSACGVALGPLRMASDGCVQQMMCASFLIADARRRRHAQRRALALLTLLGSIDTEYKAALVAMFDGHVIAVPRSRCTGQPTFRPSPAPRPR